MLAKNAPQAVAWTLHSSTIHCCCATHWIVIQPQLAISACNIPVIMSEKDWWQQAATHQLHPW
jgi:hypothetical protein